jgi:hypothetical protein
MKKILTCLSIVLILSACQVSEFQELRIDRTLENFERESTLVQNVLTTNYGFYRPFHVGIMQSQPYSISLKSHGETIAFNVDVVGIIARELYKSSLNRTLRLLTKETPLFHRVGEFKDPNQQIQTYELKITQLDERYILILRSYHVVLSADVSISAIEPVLKDMILILISSSTADDRILSTYSNIDERIDLQTQSENLFNQLAPESGTIADMINLLKGPPTLEELLREYQNLPTEEIIEGEEEGFE